MPFGQSTAAPTHKPLLTSADSTWSSPTPAPIVVERLMRLMYTPLAEEALSSARLTTILSFLSTCRCQNLHDRSSRG